MSKTDNQIKLQLSIDDIISKMQSKSADYSANDISRMIEKLKKMRVQALQREEERRHKEELLKKKQKEQEERKRRKKHIEEVTSMELPLDWENVFNSDKRTQGIHAESISDGLIMSLTNLGRVDIEYISSITGDDCKTVINTLKGSIYQNPDTWGECFYKGWETAEEYLSGNLMRKYKSACDADRKYNGYFHDNLTAIERVLPDAVAPDDIYITLGSPWVPTDIIDDFITHIFKLPESSRFTGTKHDELTGTWEIPDKSYYGYRYKVASSKTYGTFRIETMYILEKTLNMKAVKVMDSVFSWKNKSGEKKVINKEETALALEKQQKLIKEFQSWVWTDEKRKERLEMIFENNFSCVRRRIFDGSFLQFPDMSQNVQLYPYQKNAVARILFSPNTLLAHDVGSGKTYIMIAAGMEQRRMGLSKKNLYVVPNSIVGQWRDIFMQMYPSANILCIEPKSFTPNKREDMLCKIRDENYDGIIMAYSCFEQIPLSKDCYIDEIEKKKEEIDKVLQDGKKATAMTKKAKKKLDKALSELAVAMEDMYGSVYFDELGITRLFVDEAHNYKNVPIESKIDKVLGINKKGSKKCNEMMDKVHFVQRQNDGGGVVMATGTPITNSITDAYIMQQYLQSGELKMLDLQSFDSWVGMFAERVTEFEIDVDTSGYRLATRFSKFHNLPELTSLFSSIADFHQADETAEIPDFDGYKDNLIAKTADFAAYLDDISSRAEAVRAGNVSRKDDNMLKITTDGRLAALDLRLVDNTAVFSFQSKVARCAENVFDIYIKTAATRSTQLIFCDSSTPKNKFNLYDEMKSLLISYGIPSEEIAFVHSADTEKKRSALFEKMRKGEVRVLIGSTFKLGLGVNVQDRLIAVHHLDVPWRPADMTQREGRILRQGNQNCKVYIYRYITEGSFDAYSWQLLETKQRFITGLLSGSITVRSGSDIEDTVLDYAEVKALAVGNPLVKQRVEAANERARYIALQRKTVEERIRLEKELAAIPGQIAHQEELINQCENDIENYTASRREHDKAERSAIRTRLYEAVCANVLKSSETILMKYQGFDIVLPANMTEEKPFIWLKGEGKYYIELGSTEVGGLIRIDNFLDNFAKHLEKLNDNLIILERQQCSIQTELEKNESYTDKINECESELKKLDKELGVDNNE